MSEVLKKKWQDGKYREDMIQKLKVAWQRQDSGWHTAEYRKLISDVMKNTWKTGGLDILRSDWWREVRSEYMKGAWARGEYNNAFLSPTSIEIETAVALDMLAIEHESQYSPDGYGRIFDEFIEPDILIEVQGDYWHNLPEVHRRDLEKASWAKQNGFRLLTFWEHDIQECGAWALVIENVLPLLNGGNDESD